MSEINNQYIKAFEKFNHTSTVRYANNILAYCANNRIKVGSILDLSCKTGTFLNAFQLSNIKAFGTDISKDMVAFASKNYPKINFKPVKKVDEFIFKGSFEIVSCNFDYINSLPNAFSITTLFKSVYKHLSNKGFFILSIFSPRILKTTSLTFNNTSNIDSLIEVKNVSSTESIYKSTFYNNLDNYTLKSTNESSLYIYSPDDIIEMLKKVGFKSCSIVNNELFDNENQEENGRYYIFATKK